MTASIRQTAALFRPVRHVRVAQVAESEKAAPRKCAIVEGIDWDDPAVKAADDHRRLKNDEANAAQTHLDAIHSHIASAIQSFPSDARQLIHGHRNPVPQAIERSGAEASESEAALHAAHEKHTVSKLPEAARPPARMLFGQLVKHAQFMHGVQLAAGIEADKAHDAMRALRTKG